MKKSMDITMRVSCNIVYDLLPLYVDKSCTSDTSKLVEEHLQECEECRKKHEDMSIEIISTDAVNAYKEEGFKVRKIFKKIKKWWILSLICILLLIPVTLLSINQHSGDGISFTNLSDIYYVHSMLAAVKKGNYEKAFQYMNTAKLYEELTREYNTADFEELYFPVEIGNEIYYISEEVYSMEYEDYKQDKNITKFFKGIINRRNVMIPEEEYEKIKLINDMDYGFQLVLMNDGGYFVNSEYMTAGHVSEEEYDIVEANMLLPSNSDCITEELYHYKLQNAIEEENDYTEYTKKYRQMSYEEFKDYCKNNFIENMKNSTVIIEDFSYDSVYSSKSENEECYQIQYVLKCRSIDGYNGNIGLTFTSRNGKLTQSGGFANPKAKENYDKEDSGLIDGIMQEMCDMFRMLENS